jgi:dUTP pyrophosphatase
MVKIKRVRGWAKIPTLGTMGAAAFDVEWCGENAGEFYLHIGPGEIMTLGTGLAFELPPNLAMMVLPRSGLATKKQLRPANTPGLLDSDYRGELRIALENFGNEVRQIHTGDRIAQILFVPIARPLSFEVVEELTPTDRGEGGFGSTGVN